MDLNNRKVERNVKWNFKNRLKNRWEELRQVKLSNITINNIIDSHVEFLSNNNMINQNFIYTS